MKFYYWLFFILVPLTTRAQNTDSTFRSLSQKLNLTDTASQSDLFLHIDKTVYTANESVWFAAYLLRASHAEAHHTLYVVLLNEMDQSVVSSYKFALDQGLASASLPLPDSLWSGRYCLVAYTNKNLEENPAHIFRQPIDVIGLRKEPFKLEITGQYQGANIIITGHIAKSEGNLVAHGKISFTIIANGKVYKKFNEDIGSTGEITFSVPSSMPLQSLEIMGMINEGKEQLAFRRPLIWLSTRNYINFFAPDGKLIAGHPTRVGCFVHNSSGKGLSRTCVLLENNVPLATFSTDQLGEGSFTFIPRSEKQYLVKITGEDNDPFQDFPSIKSDGWAVNPINTVAEDTLKLVIHSPATTGDCFLMLHNTRSMLYGAYVKLRNREMLLNIPTEKLEPGLIHVCLFTKDGTLQEDRMVLVKNAERITANIQVDSSSYRALSKITMKVKVTNSKGMPVRGIFSFSAVLEKAATPEPKNIEVFDLYERFLSDRVLLPPLAFLKNEQNIKYELLKQENNMKNETFSSPLDYKRDKFDGYVLYNNKRPKKQIDLMLTGNPVTMCQSDATGNFNLPYLPLRAQPGTKILLTALGKNQMNYKIELTDPWARVNTLLAHQNILSDYVMADELTEEQRRLLVASKNVFLKDVVITAKKSQSENYYGKANSSGVCNDYVCQFDVLNCPYHTGVKAPEEGHAYNFETSTGIIKVIYHCEYRSIPTYIKTIPSTITYIPFIPFNPSEPNAPDVMNNTTLYWQAFIKTDEKGEAIITFRNNERKGKFKAMIQGIAANGVFSSESEFQVKP